MSPASKKANPWHDFRSELATKYGYRPTTSISSYLYNAAKEQANKQGLGQTTEVLAALASRMVAEDDEAYDPFQAAEAAAAAPPASADRLRAQLALARGALSATSESFTSPSDRSGAATRGTPATPAMTPARRATGTPPRRPVFSATSEGSPSDRDDSDLESMLEAVGPSQRGKALAQIMKSAGVPTTDLFGEELDADRLIKVAQLQPIWKNLSQQQRDMLLSRDGILPSGKQYKSKAIIQDRKRKIPTVLTLLDGSKISV